VPLPAGLTVDGVQRRLNIDGAGLTVDGLFGPLTRKALATWQARNGLQATGEVDPATAEAFKRETEPSPTVETVTVPRQTIDDLRTLSRAFSRELDGIDGGE